MNKSRIQRQKFVKHRASCISFLLALGLLLPYGVTTAHAENAPIGDGTVSPAETSPAELVAVASFQDSFDIDWSEIPSYTGVGNVTSWSVACGDGGYYFYVIGNQYSAGEIVVKNADGSSIQDQKRELVFAPDATSVKNGYWGQIEGSDMAVQQIGETKHYEAFVPDSAFPMDGFQLICGDSVVKSEDIPAVDSSTGGTNPSTEPFPNPSTEPFPNPSTEPSPKPSTEPTVPADYNGIVIDGNFDDWSAVTKTDVNENKGWNTVDHIAMVWDGDYIYLYFDAMGTYDPQAKAFVGNWTSVCGGGPHNNGQYAITTDLGNQLLIQLKNDNGKPAVGGIDNATVAVNNKDWNKAPHCWEVRIPASKLPAYKDTISFGLYQVDPLIKDVADLQGSSGGTFNGVVIDGKYEEWEYYPHTTIQYATSGTHENVIDARGALWNDSGKLYAHAETTMPAHLQEAGGEFTQAVTIKINDSTDLEFALRFIAVDADGNINWDPPRSGLADGEYEYYIVSLDAPGTSKNINDLTSGDEIYGRMKVTVGDTMDSCEWEMDVEKLAAHLRHNAEGTVITEIDPSDIKTVSVQWGRLGQKWVTTAGTSTGTIGGILLCVGMCSVPVVLISKKRKGQP